MIYDEAGDYPALQAAEKAAEAGAKVEIVTPDRVAFPEVMGMSLTPGMEVLLRHQTVFSLGRRIKTVQRKGNKLSAVFGSDYGDMRLERQVDQVVVNYGTLPLDELYFALKPASSNRGEVDYGALVANKRQSLNRNEDGAFQLFRIGML